MGRESGYRVSQGMFRDICCPRWSCRRMELGLGEEAEIWHRNRSGASKNGSVDLKQQKSPYNSVTMSESCFKHTISHDFRDVASNRSRDGSRPFDCGEHDDC